MFRAISRLLGWLWSGLDGLRKVLHLVLLLILFAAIFSLFSRPMPLVPKNAALVIAPAGQIVEQYTGDPLERAIGETLRSAPNETLLRDLVDAIEAAGEDERISSLYLDLSDMGRAGLPKLREIAAAIDSFRESGKPVIAYGDFFGQGQYYVAAHADQLYLDPHGIAYIDGFANYGVFLKDALDKLAVDWNVFRVGEYKSAVETYTRNDMSPAEREESLVWLESIWGTYKDDVAAARGFEPMVLQAYADDVVERLRASGGDLAKMALDAGLVNGLKGRFDVETQLAEITGEDEDTNSYIGVDHRAYLSHLRSTEALSTHAGDKVAFIVASGEIVPGDQPPGMIGSDTLAWQLREARFDDSIKAVVLRIDSPGGSTFASEIIRREVEALREAGKPVVASMSSLAASGGYYIAMDADRILAGDATLTGSIGVFAMLPTFERSLEKLGVHVDGVGTTALSGELSPQKTMGETGREVLQQSVEYEYEQFIARVAKARNKTVAEIDAVARGRVWSGRNAEQLGLVDGLGGYRDAIATAAELAGLGDDYEVDYFDADVGLTEALGFRLRAHLAGRLHALLPTNSVAHLPVAVELLAEEVQRLGRLSDPRHIYAYCFACSVD
jgi:protease-4